jgi:hypothetical protein
MGHRVHAPAWSLVVASALGASCGDGGNATTGATGGSGGALATTTTTTTTGGNGTSTHAVSSSASTGTGAPVCSPPAPAGSIYEKPAVTFGLDTISMCQYRGDVLLIVDTAAA